MMKIVGIAITVISIFIIGVLYYIRIKSRPDEIDFFIKLIGKYEKELKWSRKSIIEILSDFTYDKFQFYISSIIALQNEREYIDAFFDDNENFERFHLDREELAVLRHFFEYTGKIGYESELELCQKTLIALETIKTEAEQNKKKFCPLTIKLSLVTATLMIILLI